MKDELRLGYNPFVEWVGSDRMHIEWEGITFVSVDAQRMVVLLEHC